MHCKEIRNPFTLEPSIDLLQSGVQTNFVLVLKGSADLVFLPTPQTSLALLNIGFIIIYSTVRCRMFAKDQKRNFLGQPDARDVINVPMCFLMAGAQSLAECGGVR